MTIKSCLLNKGGAKLWASRPPTAFYGGLKGILPFASPLNLSTYLHYLNNKLLITSLIDNLTLNKSVLNKHVFCLKM